MAHLSLRSAVILGVSALALLGCKNASADRDIMTKDAMERIESAVETAKETRGPGHPAMWTLSDEDTTIYLFGTIHLLPENIEWKTPAFDAAFAKADRLYLEVDGTSAAAQQKIQELVMSHGMFTDGQTLSSALTPEDHAAVAAAADTVGIPAAALDPLKPWFAGLQLGMTQIMKSGYDPMSGVEQVLLREAGTDGKDFGYFESALDQVQALSGAPMKDQIDSLIFTAKTIDSGTAILDTMVDEWADGDVKGLSAMMGEPAMFGSQQAYDDLIVKRNKNWIPQIEAILEDPGVKFVAVGAGHLAGPDSVIEMLREKGYKIETPK